MSLSTNIYDLATRMATEAKALRTLINGNAGDLSGLSTTAKANLVAAINEVAAAIATAAGIDDATVATATTWSSSKTRGEIDTAAAAATAAAISDTGLSTSKAWSSTKTDNELSTRLGALINDAGTGSGTAWSSSKTQAQITAAVDALIGGAPGASDTLGELSALLASETDATAALTTAIAARVRYDAAQSLTGPQQQQARDNIGAASAAAVGDTSTNYVSAFEAALL